MKEKKTIEKILVPIDGSESADKSLDFALDLAEKYSALVTLLSVVYLPMIAYAPPGVGFVPVPYSISKFREELESNHQKILMEAEKKIKKDKPNLIFSTVLAEGRPSDKIVEAAKEGDYDIIVMGSRGIGGIKEFFLGSVSDRVADEAHCPVLIVK